MSLSGRSTPKCARKLRRWLRNLHDQLHVTSIFVTHDQEEALELADRVALLNHGRVEQIGTPKEVYERPMTPFVFGFLGAANQFHGHIEGKSVRVGNDALAYRANGFAQGARVFGFARPHELKIEAEGNAGYGIAARITRILEFGAIGRVELSGAANGSVPQHFEVELPREEIAALNLSVNQSVKLVPSKLSVFEQGGESWTFNSCASCARQAGAIST
jgi:sulfate transport system ATP-binding protein